jgi:hypothetical protein
MKYLWGSNETWYNIKNNFSLGQHIGFSFLSFFLRGPDWHFCAGVFYRSKRIGKSYEFSKKSHTIELIHIKMEIHKIRIVIRKNLLSFHQNHQT